MDMVGRVAEALQSGLSCTGFFHSSLHFQSRFGLSPSLVILLPTVSYVSTVYSSPGPQHNRSIMGDVSPNDLSHSTHPSSDPSHHTPFRSI